MLHAKSQWPAAISTSLWPYAIRLAMDTINNLPTVNNHEHKTPMESFSNLSVAPRYQDFHHFGCPVYVLKAPLQSQQSVGKWNSRARLGIYLGMSPKHSRLVALVLNPRTGLVSPQFYVKFDSSFTTVSNSEPEPTHSIWKSLSKFTSTSMASQRTRKTVKHLSAPQTKETLMQPSEGECLPDTNQRGVSEGDRQLTSSNIAQGQEPIADIDVDIGTPPTQIEDSPQLRRSPRLQALQDKQREHIALPSALEVGNSPYSIGDETDDMNDPIAFAAKTGKDTLYYHQAMKAKDSRQFQEAMQMEIDDHSKYKHWKIVPRSEIPKGQQVIDSVWAMCRKRRIKSKEVYKWKSRLNMHGRQQVCSIHYWETFSAVACWSSICLLLIISLLTGMVTRQFDFVLAYPQADIGVKQWMEIPAGVTLADGQDPKDYALEVTKNIYGGKDSGLQWANHLKQGLEDTGFEQSKFDPCVFFKQGCVFIVYVDDAIMASFNKSMIDHMFNALKDKYCMTDEGDLTDYLGVNIEHLPDNKMKLTQPHLIDEILEDLNFLGNSGKPGAVKSRDTPALSTRMLHQDANQKPHSADWK